MANYIYQILKSQLNIVWSWGFSNPRIFPNGLQFKVQGFIHNGYVKVLYRENSDLFDIFLLNYQMRIIKRIDGVYFDQLIDIIDEEVEKVDDYENRVKKFYSLI